MPKGNFVQDTFEKLAELGAGTAKKTAKSVNQTFNPLAASDKKTEGAAETTPEQIQNTEVPPKKGSHTSLDFNNLQEKYKKQDTPQEAALRNRLFQLVKEAEKEAYSQTKQSEEDRNKQITEEEAQKKKRLDDKRHQEQSEETPKGKERRSIFSPKKKKAQTLHAETRPASSKN